jgi:hypothetical protein
MGTGEGGALANQHRLDSPNDDDTLRPSDQWGKKPPNLCAAIKDAHDDILGEPHVRTLTAELADSLEKSYARRYAQTGQSSSKALS